MEDVKFWLNIASKTAGIILALKVIYEKATKGKEPSPMTVMCIILAFND